MEHKEIYVKLEDHGEVKKALIHLQSKVESAHEKLQKIKELKQREDAKIQEWEDNAATMKNKLHEVEKHLSGN